jgi:hypothetical protein
MVITSPSRPARQRGALMAELLVAIALLAMAVLPIGYAIASEKILARSYYERAVAMEIVDGEMEVLLAGEWRSFPPGRHEYAIHSEAATNLPPGKFLLTIEPGKTRLEWQPDDKHHGGPVIREALVK